MIEADAQCKGVPEGEEDSQRVEHGGMSGRGKRGRVMMLGQYHIC